VSTSNETIWNPPKAGVVEIYLLRGYSTEYLKKSQPYNTHTIRFSFATNREKKRKEKEVHIHPCN
jgi:hypothetical protein